nr:efflux RND transporter periplasmic adaptor subunit [Comamonas jiangduensis]
MTSGTPQTAPAAARQTPKWMWLLAIICVIAIIGGMWRALDHRSAKKEALSASLESAAASLSIAPHEWMHVQLRELPLGLRITGSLSAVDRAVIKARVPGELRELQLREGDSVAQGQVIARVDPTESDARFRQAQLQANAAHAQVAIQQRQHDNNRALVGKGFISETALATSAANLQAAQANYAAARAAQDAAQKSLDDTMRSPITGQVARRMAQNGSVNVEAPILEVVNLAVLELEAQLPANDSAQVRVGQNAQLQLRASNGQAPQPLQALVVRINPSASTGNRSVPVYLRLTAAADTPLRPGMYVEGFIHTGSTQALAVPLTAVRTDQPQPYVQTVLNHVVQHSPVTLGPQSVGEAQTWVAVQGLQPGQIALMGNVGGIPAGTQVQLQDAAQPRTPAAIQPAPVGR